MLTKENIIQKIEQNKNRIRLFGVEKMTLVGSYARNEAHKKSDVDLLVVFAEGRGLFDDFVHLSQFLRDLLGADVDLGEENLIRDELKPYLLGGEKVEARI
ncbi:MAG TPA: nucleotidyltransferase domain-containing protein [Candidatus Nanoarchaeia archaeon]|nr:nucleotidyltransferase domain-containing protein [Candidatus Nanoarchaeia archaeon]